MILQDLIYQGHLKYIIKANQYQSNLELRKFEKTLLIMQSLALVRMSLFHKNILALLEPFQSKSSLLIKDYH